MPTPDAKTIANRPAIVERLQQIVPKGAFGDNVITDAAGLRAYECDGLSAYRQLPLVVVLPETTSQISKILKYCNQSGVKVVARGAGTSLSGGALPLADAVLLGLGKFNQILDIDYANRAVVTQPGVTNLFSAFITLVLSPDIFPISDILPSFIAISDIFLGEPVPSIIVPFLIIRSYIV